MTANKFAMMDNLWPTLWWWPQKKEVVRHNDTESKTKNPLAKDELEEEAEMELRQTNNKVDMKENDKETNGKII